MHCLSVERGQVLNPIFHGLFQQEQICFPKYTIFLNDQKACNISFMTTMLSQSESTLILKCNKLT